MESIIEGGYVFDLKSLYGRMQDLHDSRKARGKRYKLATILVIIFLAKLCGEDRPIGIAEWARHRGKWLAKTLGLERESMPHHNTYRRILAEVVDENEFEELARGYFLHHGEAGYHVVVSMDGKVLRGTIDKDPNDGLYLLALFLPEEGITLAQVVVEDKQNEISVAPKALEYINLRNKVVIGDALHTQRQISIQIGRAGGDYLWTVKANQSQLLEDIQRWFDEEVPLLPGMGYLPKDFRSATITNKGHGRIEMRTLTTSSQLVDFLDWPFHQQVFKLERQTTTQKTRRYHREVVYGITSLSADQVTPDQLLRMLRSYWMIENSLHYRRDVTLQEDRTRFTSHSAAHIMAVINNVLLGILARSSEHRYIPAARRFFAAHPDSAFQLLIRL
jgi:predicted transposase YbfD/YdcC